MSFFNPTRIFGVVGEVEKDALFWAEHGRSFDRDFLEEENIYLKNNQINIASVKERLRGRNPGVIYIALRKELWMSVRPLYGKHDYDELHAAFVEFNINSYQINNRIALLRGMANDNYYKHLKVYKTSLEPDFEMPLKGYDKIIFKKRIDDESWYKPTGVKIEDGNFKKKVTRCDRIKRILPHLMLSGINHYRDWIFDKHIEKCLDWNCCLRRAYKEAYYIMQDQEKYKKDKSKISKQRLEPQMFPFSSWGKVDEAVDNVNKTSSKASSVLDGVSDFFKKFKSECSNNKKDVVSLAWQVFKNFIFYTISPTPAVGATLIVTTLIDLGVANFSKFAILIAPFKALFGNTENQQQESEGITGQSDDTDWCKRWSSVVTSIISVILSYFQIKEMPKADINEVMKGTFSIARNVWFVNILFKSVLEDVMRVVSKVWNWCLRKVFGPMSLKCIFAQHPEYMRDWAIDVASLCDLAREEEILHSLDLSNRVIERNIQARLLTIYMASDSNKDVRYFGVIRGLIEKIEKLYNKIVEHQRFSPVRYEPFVIWLHGPAKVGKSHAIHRIAHEMLESGFGIEANDPVYFRNPGSPYWNTLNNQPCVCYDDFMAVLTEGAADHLGEFFALKTSSPFNPPMADLGDKKRFYNPYFVFITSNDGFPKHPKVADHDAFYRRRDILVEVKLKTAYQGKNISTLDESVLKDYGHLEFSRWERSPKATGFSMSDGTYTKAEGFKEFMAALQLKFKDYNGAEQAQVAKRLKLCNSLILTRAHKNTDITKIHKKFYADLEKALKSEKSSSEFKSLLDNVLRLAPEMADGALPKYHLYDPSKYINHKVIKNDSSLIELGYKPGDTIVIADDHNYIAPHPVGCLHDWYKSQSLGVRMNYVYDDKFLGSSSLGKGLASTVSDPRMGNTFSSMSYLLEEFHESVLFIPDDKCSDPNCSYVQDSFRDLVRKVVDYQAKRRYTCGLPKFMIEEKVDRTQFQGHKMLDKAFVTFQEVNKKKFWVITDGDRNYAFPKTDDETKSTAVKIFEILCVMFKYIGYLLLIAIPLYLGSKIVSWVRNKRREVVEEDLTELTPLQPELHASGDTQTLKLAKTNRSVAKVLAEMDDQYLDGIRKGVERNTFFILAFEKEDDYHPIQARCLGINEHYAIGLKHYFERLSLCDGYMFKIAYKVKDSYTFVDINLDELIIKPFKDSGLVQFELPWRIPTFRDIRSRFYKGKGIVEINRTCELIEIQLGYPPRHFHKKLNVEYVQDRWVEHSNYSKGWNIVSGFSYPYGGKGVCGSVLVTLTKTPSIVGIHTSGNHSGNFGITEFISRDDLLRSSIVVDRIIPQMGDVDEAKFQLEGVVTAIGKDVSPVKLSEKSKIVPSLISDLWESTTEPAPLTRKDVRVNFAYSPLKYGCEKQTLTAKPLPTLDVDVAVSHLFSKIHAKVEPIRLGGDMDYIQSINGFEIDGYESIEMSTSEGYPWVKTRPGSAKDKRYLFTFENDKVVACSSKLLGIMDQKQNLRDQGIVPDTVFMDCLKDARIKREKINIPGSTRVFNIQPVDFTIQSRQYYLDFYAAYNKARFSVENTIGINVNGPEWSYLGHTLNKFSEYIICGDFKSFGDILDLYAMKKIYHEIVIWYERNYQNSKFNKARLVALDEFLQAIHVAYDFIYMVLNGQPSGFSGTIQNNSLYLSLLIRVAFINLTKLCLKEFNNLIRLFSNGDDFIMAVHPKIIDSFNNLTLCAYFKSFNIVYTAADKSQVTKPYDSFLESQYLKCNFIRHPYYSQEWLAKLEMNSIKDCPLWIKDTEDVVEASIVNSEAACRLAYGHGREFYESFRKLILEAWIRKGRVIYVPIWFEEDRRIWNDNTPVVKPEMEDAHGKEEIKVVKDSSVIIESQRDESLAVDLAENAAEVDYCVGACSKSKQTMGELSDRWILAGSIPWKASQAVNTRLLDLVLPYDVVNKNKSLPNIFPFLVHRYWRGDIEIKILINSNKFQIGQLQCSWYYGAGEDAVFAARLTNHSIAQRQHVLISAGSSNEARLYIPYKHYLTSLYTAPFGDLVLYPLDLGHFSIVVLNKLAVSSTTYSVADVQVLVRFPNSCFTGTIDRGLGLQLADYVYPEMLSSLAMKGLNCLMSDQNRDKPPKFSSPEYVVPLVSHSFATGTGGVEHLQSLRLDERGQTPHLETDVDEMTFEKISRTFGLIKTISWRSAQLNGTLLKAYEAGPLWDYTEYTLVQYDGLDYAWVPPIGVLSSLFCYWRGDIELRFDVVASQFHTGKLLVAYVPGLQSEENFSMSKAQGSPYQIFDIQEGRQFVFRVPYMSCRTWWPTRYNAADGSHTKERLGTVLIYVVNALVPMESVVNEVGINVYMRAAENFEVSVMSACKLGTALYRNWKFPNTQYAHITKGYGPAFTTYSSTYLDGKHLTMYYGNNSGQISYWDNLKAGKIYQVPTTINLNGKDYSYRLEYYDQNKHLVQFKGVAVRALNQTYPIVYLFSSITNAQAYLRDGDPTSALTYYQSGPYEEYSEDGGKTWKKIPATSWAAWVEAVSKRRKGLQPQLGEHDQVDAPVSSLVVPVSSTQFGFNTFGERVKDLKDICRRYARYCKPILFETADTIDDESWNVSFPILPQRLNITPDKSTDVDNVVREGHIAVVASGYRFSRGGLRFRIVFHGATREDQVFVQFRPDAPYQGAEPSVVLSQYVDSNTVLNLGYPCVYQGFVVSNVIEFEVPWYLTGQYNLLQYTDPTNVVGRIVNEFVSLGSVYIFFSMFVEGKARDKVKMEVFYSLADDTRFSTFIGFPAVRSLLNI